MKKNLIAAGLGLAITMSQAEASLFDVSYTLAGSDVLAGQLDGTLQADNNAVFVNSLLDFAMLNGVAGPSSPFVESVDAFAFGTPGLLPTLTLNGGFIDFIACTDSLCSDGFAFAVGDFMANVLGGNPRYLRPLSFNTYQYETFNAAAWHLNPVQVSTPSTIWLLGAGFLGLFGVRKKQGQDL